MSSLCQRYHRNPEIGICRNPPGQLQYVNETKFKTKWVMHWLLVARYGETVVDLCCKQNKKRKFCNLCVFTCFINVGLREKPTLGLIFISGDGSSAVLQILLNMKACPALKNSHR